MNKIAILDTTNFVDFPIGGQLSSIKNFLKYCYERDHNLDKFILIGITTDKNHKIGCLNTICIDGHNITFIPVAYIGFDENSVKQSLRKLFFKGLIKYIKDIKKIGICKYYIHSIEAFLPVYIWENSKKRVLFSHGNLFSILDFLRFGSKGKFLRYFLKLYIKFCINKSQKIYVLDENTLNQYRKYTKNHKVLKVKNSIDIDEYKLDGNISHKKNINLLFVGRLSKNKGVDGIINSLKILNYDEKDVSLNIVGAGEELNYLENLVKVKNLSKQVKFLGKKMGQDLVNIYNNSDILIMNSITEGTPMVMLEAMASSLAIITTPVGNIPSIVKESYNGKYTDGTSEKIACCIREVIKDIKKYKVNSFNESLKYSYKVVNKEIYEDLVS